MSSITYRADIDGLRAVAVLAVLLNHAGVPFVDGGFVGVDVFFVISGFLITSLILKDLKKGTFTFSGFWERRFRRILPALFTVIMATVIAGYFLFFPDDYASLGVEIMAQSVFGSNILFYKQTGYFDTDALLKPLLHTWSLAVEEQFYLLYPIALFIVWKLRPNSMAIFLGFSAIVSLALCIIVMEYNKNLAFYMLPFRGWELLVGSLVACADDKIARIKAPLAEFLSVLGLFSILLSIACYDKNTFFPGINALPSVLGTALIIASGANNLTTVGHILSWKPLVWIGLISYSLYLWHWPVIVLVKYNFLRPLGASEIFLCLGLSFLLAIVTWRYIETPFRRKVLLPSQRSVYAASIFALLGLVLLGGLLYLSAGLSQRLDPAVARYAAGVTDGNPRRSECDKTSVEKILKDGLCQTLPGSGKRIDFILWGDSQADAIAPVFFSLSEKYGINGYVATHHGCESILGFHKKTWDAGYDCHEFNEAVFDLIKRKRIENVFLVSAYNSWLSASTLDPMDVTLDGEYPTGYKNLLASGMARTFDSLKDVGANFYLLIDIPYVPFDPPRVLARDKFFKPEDVPRTGISLKSYMMSRNAQIEPMLDRYGRDRLVVLDPAPLLCADGTCIVEKDGYPLYYNKSHLSAHGAEYLSPLFEPYFKKRF